MIDDLTLRQTADGTQLSVRVTPRASRTQVDGVADGALRVRLAAPPVEGAANRALTEFLADLLRLPKRDVHIVAGERGRQKTILLRGLTPADIRDRLTTALAR
ncbi:DUF167 domain-containing protein [Sphaerobacter sp.]|uniref:DUF167 domain-containing protein n=1 Tax=Sphaerobacter sp. TaxID=2099654 RepID=UPI001D9E9EAB|nr:DUF167 domain-containing protein [Sphaerobacter sp.]MBX5445042.1 DUF167 domain-containing protein [Sphaerobacter sp.]